MATETLDLKGMNCPVPVMRTRKALKKLSAGDTLEVLVTELDARRDFERLCQNTGSEILEWNEDAGVYQCLFRKN